MHDAVWLIGCWREEIGAWCGLCFHDAHTKTDSLLLSVFFTEVKSERGVISLDASADCFCLLIFFVFDSLTSFFATDYRLDSGGIEIYLAELEIYPKPNRC